MTELSCWCCCTIVHAGDLVGLHITPVWQYIIAAFGDLVSLYGACNIIHESGAVETKRASADSLRSWRSQSMRPNSVHGRHFVLVAGGRLRASDKIMVRGKWGGKWSYPLPCTIILSLALSLPSATSTKWRPWTLFGRIDWDRQLRRLFCLQQGVTNR